MDSNNILLDRLRATEHERWFSDIRPEVHLLLRDMVEFITDGFDYNKAHARYRRDKECSNAEKEQIIRVLNDTFLKDLKHEWTSHKISRSFRYWGEEEKKEYLQTAAKLVSDIQEKVQYSCFGYGSVLSIVRDNCLIPHDDDLDILVAFPIEEMRNFRAAKGFMAEFLRGAGYDVRTAYKMHAHIKAGFGRKKFVDVFVGLIEGDKVSWYPGPRRELNKDKIFPSAELTLMDVACQVPHDVEHYLEKVYGDDWRTPIARWKHHYSESDFEDLLDPRFLSKKTNRIM